MRQIKRQTRRQTDRKTVRATKRLRGRQTEAYKQRDPERDTCIKRKRHAERHIERERQTDIETDRQTGGGKDQHVQFHTSNIMKSRGIFSNIYILFYFFQKCVSGLADFRDFIERLADVVPGKSADKRLATQKH